MDRERFDALTRMFATKGSRRAAFAGFLSAALLGTGAEALAKSGKGKHRGQHQDRGKGHDNGHDQGTDAGQEQEQAKHGAADVASADATPKAKDGTHAAPAQKDVQAETRTRSASASKGKGCGQGKSKGKGKNQGGRQEANTQAIPASCCGAKGCSPPTKSSNRASCDFAGQSISGNYSGSSLAKIDGRGATFAGNASSVSFANACLQFSVFTANVQSAQFGDACLFGADFSGAVNFNSTVFKGAILCQTKVPGGGIRNDDCNNPTTCCQTCIDVGQKGCSAVGDRCCGAATCKNDTCVCPTNRVPCKNVCCPVGQICQNGKCVNPCQPQCEGKVCGPDTCGGTCPPGCTTGQTCLGGQCCPNNRVCGTTCLTAPCDASKCLTCDPQTGTCVSTCGANETCIGGTCCPNSRVCGATCLAAPCDATTCQSCNPATGTCQSACPAGQTCLRGTECCPNDRVCGNACLAAPCDATQCLTCNAPGGVCVSSCSGATPFCIGGTSTCLPTVPISPCPPSCTAVGPCAGCCGGFCQNDDLLGLICSN